MTITYALRTLGPSEAIPDNDVAAYYLDDLRQRVSVARVDGHLYAFDGLCPCGAEPGCPLSGGLLTATTIMCQCHGSRFDITTGSVLRGPANRPLRVYQVREADGNVEIRA